RCTVYRSPRPLRRRKGSVLPLFVITVTILLGFLALGIDVGMMALARTQCQNAADCSALVAARALSGDPTTNNNIAACDPAARKAASANKILSSPINGNDPQVVIVEPGAYVYDASSGQFSERIPKGANDPYSLARVTVSVKGNSTFFGGALGLNTFDVS